MQILIIPMMQAHILNSKMVLTQKWWKCEKCEKSRQIFVIIANYHFNGFNRKRPDVTEKASGLTLEKRKLGA